MKAYKGMDKDMKCNGFQYKVGEKYETDKAKACQCGFHACEYPLDVFHYYYPAYNRFFQVDLSGDIDKLGEDSKAASTKIKIKKELSVIDLVKSAVECIKERCENNKVSVVTRDFGISVTTECVEDSIATGKVANSIATSGMSNSISTGYSGNAIATGNKGNSIATEEKGNSFSTGDYGNSFSTGRWGNAIATGMIGSSFSTGNMGSSIATGCYGAASATGKASVAMACGVDGKVMGGIGCALFLVERGKWNGKTDPIIYAKSAIVDGVKIKPNVWYKLKNGEFVEAK